VVCLVSIAFIWELLSNAVQFYLPALAANVAVYLAFYSQGKLIDIPIDLYYTKKKRIVGPSRSVGGFFIMVLAATLVGTLQNRPVLGFLLGAGAFVGTVVSSVIKRALNINRGNHFFLDHFDFIIGATLFAATYEKVSLEIVIMGLIICAIMHMLVNIFIRPKLENLS
jgi:hypothetical protein